MLKKTFVFCCIALFYAAEVHCYAPPVRSWQQAIGGSASDNGTRMVNDGSGGFWILGSTESSNGNVINNNGSSDVFLVHTAADGQVVNTYTFGGNGIDLGTDMQVLPDGNLIIAGYTSSGGFAGSSHGGYDGFLMCVDTNGLVLWSSRFGGSNADLIYHLDQTANGFILTGGTYSSLPGNPTHGDQDFWVVNLDPAGNILWQQNYGGSSLDIAYGSILQNGIIKAIGLTLSSDMDVTGNHGGLDVWLVEADETTGALLSQHCYGGSSNDAAFSIRALSTGNIAFGGYSRSSDGDLTSNYGYNDAWIAILDASLNIVLQNTFGGSGSDVVYAMDETTDGIVLGCSSTSTDVDITNNAGLEDVWMLKVDFSLTKIWSRSFGGLSNDRPASVLADQSDIVTICGYSLSNSGDISGNHGSSDLWIFHLECLAPEITISGNTALTCAGDTVRLVDRSINVGSKQWYLNNNLLTGNDTLELTIGNAGNYIVSLSGKTCAASDSASYPFTLNNCSPPVADFTSAITSVCQNGNIQFTDQSLLATSYEWEFPGGIPSVSFDQNPIVTYPTAGTFEVILTSRNAYGSSTLNRSTYIEVNPAPVAPAITVTGSNLFCNTSLPIEWFTNNGSISNDPLLFNVADGYYNAIITDANGCSVSTDTIQVLTNSVDEKRLIGVAIYPNPVQDFLTVKSVEKMETELRDATGRLISEQKEGTEISIIPMHHLPAGLYYLKVSVKGNTFFRQIIKAN